MLPNPMQVAFSVYMPNYTNYEKFAQKRLVPFTVRVYAREVCSV